MHYKRSINAPARNYCCSGKAIRTTYSECVSVCSLSYPACNAHVLYYIVICGLSASTILLNITSYTVRCSEKGVEHKMHFALLYIFLKKISHSKMDSERCYHISACIFMYVLVILVIF